MTEVIRLNLSSQQFEWVQMGINAADHSIKVLENGGDPKLLALYHQMYDLLNRLWLVGSQPWSVMGQQKIEMARSQILQINDVIIFSTRNK